MSENEITLNTQLELSEIINQCFINLKEKGYFEKEIQQEKGTYENRKTQFKCFETILATGLYQIIKNGEIKTNFNYLGNNNNINLIFNVFKLSELLKNKYE